MFVAMFVYFTACRCDISG